MLKMHKKQVANQLLQQEQLQHHLHQVDQLELVVVLLLHIVDQAYQLLDQLKKLLITLLVKDGPKHKLLV
jgi:hypothetical protein